MSAGAAYAMADSVRRVPAEWEPQEAIRLQWPGRWEKSHETAFARMSSPCGAPCTSALAAHSGSRLRETRRLIATDTNMKRARVPAPRNS